jgi:hypothetical protein
MRRITALWLVAMLMTVMVQSAAAYQVTSGHPRLFFVAGDLPALRSKCTGPLSSDYQDIKNWCDENMNTPMPLASIDFYEDYLAAYSFVWLMSQNSSYAAKAKAVAQYAMGQGYSGSGTYTRGMALFFDWCYDYLTPTERQTFGNAVLNSCMALYNGENWVMMNNYHSKLSRLKEFAYCGLAVYGEGIDNPTATFLCDMFHEHTFGPQYTLACVEEIAGDGAYFEGSYTTGSLAGGFREGCWIWDVATDEDVFALSGNLQNMATYYLYEMFAKNGPGAGAFMSGSKQGDSESHTLGASGLRLILYSLANKYRDGQAQWLAREIEAQGLGYINRYHRWKLIVYQDPSLAEQPPTGMPSSWWFQDMGTAYFRSGWDLSEYSTDVYSVFRCEQLNAGHTNAHQNHFLIARGNDLLAIDSGIYDGGISLHHLNYFERTIAHNTITVMNPAETTFSPSVNDGGQIPPSKHQLPTYYGEASQPPYTRGKIVAFDRAEEFSYAKGDATQAYGGGKLDLFTREIVYLEPDVFIIFDRVRATSASYAKKWLLHTIEEPAITGDTFVVDEGGSRMFVKSLLPAQRQMVKVGGSGHQFDVNGTNYPPSQSWTRDMGAWRVEVSPTVVAQEDLFLHVLYVTSTSTSTMPSVSLIEADEMIGVEVDGNVVLFNRSADAVDSVTYEYGGSR